ncbi:hypothetical protein Bhyg_08195 [Pseudolycoriella hygida]|uniref:Uncharacterized protein n=1 Tax=Pseudolycoriella hygida TaxID=35572 RepID=A0A9Q0N463_9DIPT|nr:hypothetical protein Bhyg_08195 [Pseudolycoriella hygida]
MDRLQLILVLFSYCLYLVLCQSSNLVCTKEFCDNYKQMVGCPGLHIACVAQNSTHSGTILRSATPCSCCETCLEHLREGEYCTIGWPGSPVPTSVCGPGLKCQLTSKDEHPICEKINDTECYKQQIAFDEANKNASFEELMGRPSCDGEGYFNPLKCNEEM